MNSRIIVLAVFLSLITALSACSKDLGQNEQFYPSDGLEIPLIMPTADCFIR
jgi:hypothetical protein